MVDMDKDAEQNQPNAFERQWHYMPDVPIKASPFFTWPLDFKRMFIWVADRWFAIAENSILIVVSLLTWLLFQPSLEDANNFSIGWIAMIYARNFALLCVVAGGLHLYFHRYKNQDKRLKYDRRDLRGDTKGFTFNNQVKDNMFWSLGSGVALWSAYEVIMFWAMANGYIPTLLWADNPLWFIALFFLTPIWISFHFYWIHRWLHWPPLYNLAHALHHRNTNVGPWSGFSMHPVEHLLFLSSVLIHVVIAAHPLHILFHMQHQALTAASSHTGFEGLLVKDKNPLALGTFHHQMHHRYFECNYGNLEMPWDKWFGSFHDGTYEANEKMKIRRMERMG